MSVGWNLGREEKGFWRVLWGRQRVRNSVRNWGYEWIRGAELREAKGDHFKLCVIVCLYIECMVWW